MSEYVHHYSKIHVNNVAKVRDWLQAGSLPKSFLPLQTSNEVDTQAQRMKTLSLSEARGGELNSKAEDANSKIKEDYSNELCSMFPKLNPHQLYQVLIKNQFDLQKAIESLLDIPQSSTKSRSRNIAKTGSSFPEYGAASQVGNVVSGTSRTEPLHHLRTEITANSRTWRSSQTVSGTKSSVVSSNITRTTPHTYETCNAMAIMARTGSLPPSVFLLSPSRSTPAMPPYPECAVCFTSLAGCRINQDMYQCTQGHLLCADCKEREFHVEFRDIIKNLMTDDNSRTRRSPTDSGTKSSVVSSNVTRTTPHNLDTRSILTGHRSRPVSRSLPVSPVSPSQPAAPPMPPCPECPVCFTSLAGSRIFQCAQGHSLCGDCIKNPQVKNCPTCRGKLMGRATNMEQLLASIYSGE